MKNLIAFFITASVASLLSPIVAAACPSAHGLLDLNCDKQIVIVCFGDSITRGIGDSEGLGYPGRLALMLPGVTIFNYGSPGEKTESGRTRVHEVFSEVPFADYVIILEGVNDYFDPDRSVAKTESNLLSIQSRASSGQNLALLSKLTAVKREFQQEWVKSVNSALFSEAKVNFFALGTGIISGDRLHPHSSGYQRMAEFAYATLLLESESFNFLDSDNDGTWDFGEAKFGTNPLSGDSDSDGISDTNELFFYMSNPNLGDSDGDGLSDYREIAELGTNPNSALPTAPIVQSLELLTPFEERE